MKVGSTYADERKCLKKGRGSSCADPEQEMTSGNSR